MRTLLVAVSLAVVVSSRVSSGLTTEGERVIDASVAIRTFQFAPDTLRVEQGTRVVWSNNDDIEHTITSGTQDNPDGRLNGVVDKRGATYSATLEKPGIYSYFCDRHRFMNGTVIVSR